MTEDKINWPKHYNFSTLQVIDVIEGCHFGYALGNAVKYICRAGIKDPDTELEDLDKAEWYLEHFIQKHPDDCIEYAELPTIKWSLIHDAWLKELGIERILILYEIYHAFRTTALERLREYQQQRKTELDMENDDRDPTYEPRGI